MGMSASQARLLSLQARQSNLEYQGQQINQERTILSQQCTALYNSLLAMDVPTPPSTQDYTTIEYSGTDGATTFTLGTIKPSGENYNVEIQQTATGKALTQNYGSSVVGNAGEDMRGEYVSITSLVGTGTFGQVQDGSDGYKEGDIYIDEIPLSGADLIEQGADPDDYMTLDGDGYSDIGNFDKNGTYYKKVSKSEYDAAEDKTAYSHLRENTESKPIQLDANDLSNYYVVTGDKVSQLTTNSPYVEYDSKTGKYTIKDAGEGTKYFKASSGGSDTLTNPNAGALTIGGKVAYTFDQAIEEFGDEFDWEGYREAIRNTYGAQDDSVNENDFYVFVVTSDTGVRSIQFALKDDVESPDKFAQTYSFTANGQYTTSEAIDDCRLQFDTQGRITKISVPTKDSATGEIISYKDIDLTAKTVTDEVAYQDAYNQYEYAQYEYDKKQQEINAQTSIIQQEDRNLELKLQRLDNERTQITTEIEAVEKVINDNIEASYKTFSG